MKYTVRYLKKSYNIFNFCGNSQLAEVVAMKLIVILFIFILLVN